MKKDIIEGNFSSECWNIEIAKKHVCERKNIFATWTRRYIFQTCPAIIKEVSKAPDGSKSYWFWCFLPTKKIIYMFDKKPTRKEIEKMMGDYYKEKERRD